MKIITFIAMCLVLGLSTTSFAIGPNDHAVKGMAMKQAHANAHGLEHSAAGIVKAKANKAAAEARKAAGKAHKPDNAGSSSAE